MSDEKKPDGTEPKTPAAPTKIVAKYNGQNVEYDLTKAEDVERLRTRAEIGQFAEGRTAEIKQKEQALEAERAKLAAEAQIGREFTEFVRSDPAKGGILRDLYQGLREGTLEPSQVRSALSGVKSGDAEGVAAQASAAGDPEARALLRQIAAKMEVVESSVEGIKSKQSQRELEAEIASTVGASDTLRGRKVQQEAAARRVRELVATGIPVGLAASQAIQEIKDMLSESATQERDRLTDQKGLAATKPTGMPVISDLTQLKVDPKAPKQVQIEQRRERLKDAYRRLASTFGSAAEG